MSRPISIFVCLLLLANLSLAWWDVGHMTVAQIAELYLIENGKVDAFNKFNQLILAFKGRTDGKTDTFVEAAVWPDDIKNYKKDANSEEQDYVRYFDSYHYTDLYHFYLIRTYDPHFLMASMKQKEKDVNSINIIGSAVTVLKNNKEKVTFERAFMARYLLHLAGDMHQPLHSTAMFN